MMLEITELWTAVYVSNLARIGMKICENAFRTIPEIFFSTPKKIFSQKFRIEKIIFRKFCEVSDDAQRNGRHHQLGRQIWR